MIIHLLENCLRDTFLHWNDVMRALIHISRLKNCLEPPFWYCNDVMRHNGHQKTGKLFIQFWHRMHYNYWPPLDCSAGPPKEVASHRSMTGRAGRRIGICRLNVDAEVPCHCAARLDRARKSSYTGPVARYMLEGGLVFVGWKVIGHSFGTGMTSWSTKTSTCTNTITKCKHLWNIYFY